MINKINKLIINQRHNTPEEEVSWASKRWAERINEFLINSFHWLSEDVVPTHLLIQFSDVKSIIDLT